MILIHLKAHQQFIQLLTGAVYNINADFKLGRLKFKLRVIAISTAMLLTTL